MNANVSKLLNEQINKEFYSAYLYLDFANYYAAVGLDGFENWYRVQAQEERDHAMLFYQYLQNNGEDVTFPYGYVCAAGGSAGRYGDGVPDHHP